MQRPCLQNAFLLCLTIRCAALPTATWSCRMQTRAKSLDRGTQSQKQPSMPASCAWAVHESVSYGYRMKTETPYDRGNTTMEGFRMCAAREREGPRGSVTLRTAFGVNRVLDMLSGEHLPRIC